MNFLKFQSLPRKCTGGRGPHHEWMTLLSAIHDSLRRLLHNTCHQKFQFVHYDLALLRLIFLPTTGHPVHQHKCLNTWNTTTAYTLWSTYFTFGVERIFNLAQSLELPQAREAQLSTSRDSLCLRIVVINEKRNGPSCRSRAIYVDASAHVLPPPPKRSHASVKRMSVQLCVYLFFFRHRGTWRCQWLRIAMVYYKKSLYHHLKIK